MELEKAITQLIQKEIDKGKLQGCAVEIIHKDQVKVKKYFGEEKEGNIYRIFSMTKPVTAVACMILYERGILDLFEPVSNYLSGFKNCSVITEEGICKAKTEMTIAHLLNMTSGIVYPFGEDRAEIEFKMIMGQIMERIKSGEQISTVDFCNAIGSCPLAFHPGEQWYYGASADILGGVIEQAAKIPFGEFLEKEIFYPLQMEDTSFYLAKEKKTRLAIMYTRDEKLNILRTAQKQEIEEMGMSASTDKPMYESGGGGLYSTLEDYSKFAEMLLHQGTLNGVRILGRKTVEYMTQNQLSKEQEKYFDFESTKGYGYGNLFRVLLNKAEAASNGSLGEFGWSGKAGTYFMVDKEEDLVLVYMQQIAQGGDLGFRRKLRQVTYGAL